MDAPEKVCLLRLSAIGDTCHVVPLLRTLQSAWPRTRFTWVIGKLEAKLMSLIPDVELITVDKGAGLSAFSRLRTEMKRRGAFDLLLHLQLSIRASATAACIPAPIKLGFDKPRARELQWLFTNRRIAATLARARAGQLPGVRRRARRPAPDSRAGTFLCRPRRSPTPSS